MIKSFSNTMDGYPMQVHLLVSHIPVDMHNFLIDFGVMIRKDPNLDEAANLAMLGEYTAINVKSFHHDVAIWNNKCIIDNPLMCDGGA